MLVLLAVSYGSTELAVRVLSLWMKVDRNGTSLYNPDPDDLSVQRIKHAHIDAHNNIRPL